MAGLQLLTSPGTLADVVKSVLALVVGIMLMLGSAAGYAYVTMFMAEDAPPESTTADTGVAACEALLAQPERDSLDDLDAAIIAGLAGSANADLKAAGSTLEALSQLPPEQQPAAAPQVLTALTQVIAGCAALGVTLPDPSGQPSPS